MKKILMLGMLFITSFVMAQDYVLPIDPTILGKGGTVLAQPNGFGSFFHNPAGLATNKEFQAINVTPWLFTDTGTVNAIMNADELATNLEQFDNPDTQAEIEDWFNNKTEAELALIISSAGYTELDIINAGGIDAFIDSLSDEEMIEIFGIILAEDDFPVSAEDLGIPGGDVIMGMHNGIYYIGNNLGIALFNAVEVDMAGGTVLAAVGTINDTLSLHVGYSWQVVETDLLDLYVGGQIRPYYGVEVPVAVSEVSSIMGSEDPSYVINNMDGRRYFGIGLDAGVILDLWWFSFGLSAFDIPKTMLIYEERTVGDMFSGSGSSPAIFEMQDPMRLGLGMTFHPDLGHTNKYIDVAAHLDFQDIIESADIMRENPKDFMNIVNMGVEVELLSSINTQFGYYDEYYTVGFGLDLSIIEFNVAAAVDTLKYSDISDFGIAAEIAIRF